MKKFLMIMSIVLMPVVALALDLDAAKQQGLIGERPDGYIAAVASSPSADVKALVTSINEKRKAKYSEIAAKNGQAVNVVEALAAKKVYEQLGAGEYYVDSAGAWAKK